MANKPTKNQGKKNKILSEDALEKTVGGLIPTAGRGTPTPPLSRTRPPK